MRKFFIALLLLGTASLHAGDPVYRYTDANGVIHYTDKPPSKDAQPAKLPEIQTIPGNTPVLKPLTKSEPVAPAFKLRIDSPSPDQTYRENGTTINVAVSVMPGLVQGYGLIYSVDGTPQGEATQSTTFTVNKLERGSHTISVALVDAKNKPVTSSSVTVHLKPPTAKPQLKSAN